MILGRFVAPSVKSKRSVFKQFKKKSQVLLLLCGLFEAIFRLFTSLLLRWLSTSFLFKYEHGVLQPTNDNMIYKTLITVCIQDINRE